MIELHMISLHEICSCQHWCQFTQVCAYILYPRCYSLLMNYYLETVLDMLIFTLDCLDACFVYNIRELWSICSPTGTAILSLEWAFLSSVDLWSVLSCSNFYGFMSSSVLWVWTGISSMGACHIPESTFSDSNIDGFMSSWAPTEILN